jgi:serine/threonine protein kinase
MLEIAEYAHETSRTRILGNIEKGVLALSREFDLSKIYNRDDFFEQFNKQKQVQHHLLTPFTTFRINESTVKIKRDFVAGTSLARFVRKRNSPEAALMICRNLSEVVYYLHSHGFVIKTLHPTNIIIDAEGLPHIVDFGLNAIVYDQLSMKTNYESVILLSPEGFDKSTPLTKERDIWILGNILYKQLFFRQPYECHNIIRQMNQILNKKLTLPEYERTQFNECIFRALSPNPEERSTAKELYEAIKPITPNMIVSFVPSKPLHSENFKSMVIKRKSINGLHYLPKPIPLLKSFID